MVYVCEDVCIVNIVCGAMHKNSDLTSLLIVPEGQSFRNPLYLCKTFRYKINIVLYTLHHRTHHLFSSLGETVNTVTNEQR